MFFLVFVSIPTDTLILDVGFKHPRKLFVEAVKHHRSLSPHLALGRDVNISGR